MPKIPIYPPIRKVEISLYYEDKVTRGSHTFATVHELAAFLKENPALAQAVKYTVKGKS